MNKEFNLDDYKEVFSKSNGLQKSSTDIKSMLNSSSINNVKYILIISIVELIFGVTVFLFLYFNTTDIPHSAKAAIPAENLKIIDNFANYYNAFFIVTTLITIGFIIYFFNSYKKLQVQSNVKEFTKQILDFRKAANFFIYFNIFLFSVIFITLFYFSTDQAIQILKQQGDIVEQETLIGFYVGALLGYLGGLLFLFVYYRLIWGTFLRRLKRNQKELEAID